MKVFCRYSLNFSQDSGLAFNSASNYLLVIALCLLAPSITTFIADFTTDEKEFEKANVFANLEVRSLIDD